MAYAYILTYLPVSYDGLGTREASLTHLSSTENLSSESELAISLLVIIYIYLIFAFLGFYCLITMDHHKKEL